MTIAVIGATGLLGRAMMKAQNTIACPIRFESHDKFGDWFDQNPMVDTVWHVARACRKNGVRRDRSTFLLETNAMRSLLKTRAKDCRFVYASTKVVYGITHEDVDKVTANQCINEFSNPDNGVVNLPLDRKEHTISLNNLGKEHKIYALTKLICEGMVRKYCSKFKILRIWDIID